MVITAIDKLVFIVIIFLCSIGELVKHEVNGLLFSNADELYSQLELLFLNFPKQNPLLLNYRRNLKQTFAKERWTENWNKVALPIFK